MRCKIGLGFMTEEVELKVRLFLAITREVDPYESEIRVMMNFN